MNWKIPSLPLPSDLHGEEHIANLELFKVPKTFSMTSLLSPAAEQNPCSFIVTKDRYPIDSTHLILLALNEECRSLGKGAFYHLPSRADPYYGHACDMIFVRDRWSSYDQREWDGRNWSERLQFFTAISEDNNLKAKIDPSENVLAVCARIFKCDTTSAAGSEYSDGSYSAGTTNTTLADTQPHYHYSTASDPAIKSNSLTYSRPIQDQSHYNIIYTSRFSTPLVCLTSAMEHESLTTRCLTPNDLSETFNLAPRDLDLDFDKFNASEGLLKAAELAQAHMALASVGTNREVVGKLWDALEGEDTRSKEEEAAFGRVSWTWQELLNEVETPSFIRTLPNGWPLA